MDDTVIDGEDADGSASGGDGGDATEGQQPEKTFGRYGLLSMLGAGGMGQVWRARDSQTNRVVALKVLPEHSADDDESRERFRRECEAVAQLTEPHIIPIHDFGDVDGRLFFGATSAAGHEQDDGRHGGHPCAHARTLAAKIRIFAVTTCDWSTARTCAR